ncbi:MAG: 6-bladed beta-propeller [Gemmatimonadota bacterium]|nr:6-bladed beta-propeller [Gemmatimonadota bacterium]
MARLKPVATVLLLTCPSTACESQAGDADFVETDSAGVAILESFQPQWDDGHGWTVALEPELAIGAGPEGGDDPDNPPWGRVRGLNVLSNGSLVVGDASTSEVMVFDSTGQFTHRFGGQGEGPGELEDFSTVFACDGDTIIAADVYAYNYFDSEGRFLRRLATVDGRTQMPLSVFLRSGDCRRFLVTDRYPTAEPEGPQGLTYWDFAWTDESFAGRDTVARVIEGHELRYAEIFTRAVPWTTRVLPIRLTGDDLLFGYSQRAELRIVASDGALKRILRWHATPDPITTEERQEWNSQQVVGSESGRRIQLDDFPWLPEHKPFFDRLLADDEGNIWVRTPPPPDPARERWTVLGSDGRWLGTVQMPGGFRLSQVARGRVYGIHRDELGVPTVRVHHLDKGG